MGELSALFLFFMVLCSDRGGSHFGDCGEVDVERFIRGLRQGGLGSSYKRRGAARGQGWVVFVLF